MLATWRSAVAPAAFALLVAAGGELNRVLGQVALFVTLGVTALGVALLVAIPVNLVKRRPFLPALVGLATCFAANVVATRVVFGVPLFVKAEAAPAIAAVESWRRDHGSYPVPEDVPRRGLPPELGVALDRTTCMYFTRDSKATLGCRGVVFTKCDYDFESKTWSSWD